MTGAAEVYRTGNLTQWLPVAEQRIVVMKAELVELQNTHPGVSTQR
jgi:hypothetical protein